MKATTFSRRARKNLKQVLRPAALWSIYALAWLEKRVWPDPQLAYSPVFIIAPPRSGTTLLYQVMTSHLSTCYFTNLAAKLHIGGGPAITIISARLGKLFNLAQPPVPFRSYYGHAKGLSGPHEAHMIWDQKFPEDKHAVTPGYLSEDDRQVIYRSVAGIERVFDRPFINKCIRNSVRIEAIAEIFPTAIFIECVRDPVDVAQSIYIARTQEFPFQDRTTYDPMEFWFSVKPKEYETIKQHHLITQVCEQVFYVEQSIACAKDSLGHDRFLSINYRDLCHAPLSEIERIVKFMNSHNAPTKIINPLPDSFPFSTGRKIDNQAYLAITQCLEELYGLPMVANNL